jgi:hypothetical protein
MKKYNSIFTGLCFTIIVFELFLFLIINQSRVPLNGPGDSQGGIGIFALMTLLWTVAWILMGIMIIATIAIGLVKKELMTPRTLLTLGLEIVTLGTPILLLFF